MIEQIVLNNFKSIVRTDVSLGNLNVLIGRNGSGKSNFLNFLSLLREGAIGQFNQTINSMGGFSEIAHYNNDKSPIFWTVTLSDVGSQDTLYYHGEINPRGMSGYTVHLEELSRPPFSGHNVRYKYLSVTDGRVRILKTFKDEEDPPFDESDQELAISNLKLRNRYTVQADVRSYLSDWSIFRGFGNDALQKIRSAQSFDVVEPLRLDVLGGNLVSILQKLANESEYSSVNDHLNEAMQTVFPDFVKLDISIRASGMGALGYRSRDLRRTVSTVSMSDGQLRFLGLTLLLLLPNPPPLIAIDEPEVGMHPEMLEVFADLLKQASARTQLIISTHSSRLLDFIAPENIITVERKQGETTLERLDYERLQGWLDRYTLGKLWTMGKLEPR